MGRLQPHPGLAGRTCRASCSSVQICGERRRHRPPIREDVCDNAAVRRAVIASVVAAAVLVVAGVVLLRVQREREWADGGDRLTVHVEVSLATQDTFEDVAVRLGAPPRTATRLHSASQSVVVRVRWSASAHSDGSFQLLALDGRVTPPRPLAADGGWNSEGATGSNWAGAYETLAQHYDWLAGVAEANYTDVNGMTNFPTAAVDAPATEAGTATAWFRQWGDGPIPFADAKRDIVVALSYVDDGGEVRWARRIFG